MGIIKTGASVVALVTALGGYMSWKYGTTSACEAAGTAIRLDMPKILDDLAAEDIRFRALRVGGALFGSSDALISGIAGEVARSEVEDRTALECAYLVGQREIDSAGFRKTVGEAIADDLAGRLPF